MSRPIPWSKFVISSIPHRFGHTDDEAPDHGAGQASHPAQDDDDKRDQREGRPDIRGKGHEGYEKAPGCPDARRSDPEADRIGLLDVRTHQEGAGSIIRCGSNQFSHVSLLQEEHDGKRHDDGKGEGEKPRYVDHQTSDDRELRANRL